MKQLRQMGLALIAVLALGAVVAATASAAEAGLLYLPGEEGAMVFTGTGGVGTLTAGANTITCEKTTAKATSTQTKEHVTSGTVNVTFNLCKEKKGESKLACNTEGAAKEEIVTSGTFTLFNALDRATKKVLEPGIGVTLSKTLVIKCGVGIVEVKGTTLGLITEVSLTADNTTANLHFLNEGELCDTGDKFCEANNDALLANFSGTFELATEQTDVKVTGNKMFVVDD